MHFDVNALSLHAYFTQIACMEKTKRDPNQLQHETHDHGENCCVNTPNKKKWGPYKWPLFSFVLLIIGLIHDQSSFYKAPEWLRLAWYIAAYLPIGLPVLKTGWKNIQKGDVFTEFFLMSIATIGAFVIGEYPEGVAVMLFYTVGELFQHDAVKRARGNIKALLDARPNKALVFRDGSFLFTNPETVGIGERIQVRVGEKIPLDGKLLSDKASINTSAITGESRPDTIRKGENVYAGSINLENVIEVETTKEFKDSSISRILDMVQNATARKSKTELFIRKFARVYTPIVVFLAIALTFLPYLFVEDYVFRDWLYRALIFLVVSCPCALVISIPLGYFGGLGAASRNGILFKGASFLDTMTKVNTVVMDKTGTMTKGVFKMKEIEPIVMDKKEFMGHLMAMEAQSTHPIAVAIKEYKGDAEQFKATNVMEVAGKGLQGTINGKEILVGNKTLMTAHEIVLPESMDAMVDSLVILSIDNKFSGYVTIADELKEDAQIAVGQMRNAGIEQIGMLSGDKDSITQQIGKTLALDWAKGGLLPEEKLNEVEQLKRQPNITVAFVGDGINDAPVLAMSDVGIAMGGLGSDVAIETADVIIQNDQPSKIAKAIKIARSTRDIVWQNIGLAFGVKAFVLILGAGGLATMWQAVFADVGVALLAVLNAVRLQRMQW